MKPRQYKVQINNTEFISFITKEEVIKYLEQFNAGKNPRLSNVEIFDPSSGWNLATNWLKLKEQKVS